MNSTKTPAEGSGTPPCSTCSPNWNGTGGQFVAMQAAETFKEYIESMGYEYSEAVLVIRGNSSVATVRLAKPDEPVNCVLVDGMGTPTGCALRTEWRV